MSTLFSLSREGKAFFAFGECIEEETTAGSKACF
jgi:hypothetical protein